VDAAAEAMVEQLAAGFATAFLMATLQRNH
jgi:hypothetical protein